MPRFEERPEGEEKKRLGRLPCMPQTSNLATRFFLLWMCLLWTLRNCGNLGVKLLSSRFLGALEQRIRDICKLEWDCEIIDLESGFFLTRFYSKRDYLNVLNNGPWVILGHSLTLTKWRPAIFGKSFINSWEVPISFFEESVLLKMGNLVGRALKVDDTTMEVSRGRFARVCVEIDLSNKFLGWAIHLFYFTLLKISGI